MSTRFDTYSEYAASLNSEKLTMAHVHAFQQVFNFTLDSGNVYKRSVSNFVTGVKRAGVFLTSVSDSSSVDDETKYYYDIKAKELYLYSLDGDLADEEVILEVRLFFSNAPINAAWTFADDNAFEVEYEPRLTKAPGFKSEVGTDQQGISVTGTGTITLENSDGYLDDLYDTLFFELKLVEIYSYHRDLPPTEAKILYRGFITDKAFTEREVSLKISDSLFKLDQKVPLSVLTASDGVSAAFEGQFKRRIYGRLDGLLMRSVDQIGTGFTLTGTVSNTVIGNQTLSGTGTLFLDEVSPGDTLTIDQIEYEVETVNSDTSLTLSDSDGLQTVFSGNTVSSVPDRPWRKKNRTFIIAGHALKQVNTTVTQNKELNRLAVADPTGIEVGDILSVNGESVTVRRISSNLITTLFNMLGLKSVGDPVLKQPVQKVYIEGNQIDLSDIDSISNTSSGATVTISDRAEFNIARNKALPSFINFTWTNGSRTITTTADVDLQEFVQPRDWIRRSIQADTEYLEILQVTEQSIITRTAYTGATDSDTGVVRTPTLIGDDSNVSADVLGKTKDGTAFGDLIETGPEVIEDLLKESDLSSFIDTASFNQASLDADYRVSIKIPFDISSTTAPTVRSIVNDINTSIFGALVLNNDLNLAYNILDVTLDSQTLPIIAEDDVISFRIKGKSSRLFKAAQTQYSFQDFDPVIKESVGRAYEYTSDFVTAFETSNKTEDLRLSVFDFNSARTLTQRFVFFNSLSEAVIELESSLNLSSLSMGDQVILDFDRLYKRLGDFSTRKKVGTVIGIDRTGDNIKLKISDLGNLFNRAAVISDNAGPEYSASTSEDLLITSHITDGNGLVDDEEQTSQSNLIT